MEARLLSDSAAPFSADKGVGPYRVGEVTMIGGAKPTLFAGRDAMMSFSIPACVEGGESGSDVQAASSGRPTNTSRAVATLILVMAQSLQFFGVREKAG
jgi:hypothetical protein